MRKMIRSCLCFAGILCLILSGCVPVATVTTILGSYRTFDEGRQAQEKIATHLGQIGLKRDMVQSVPTNEGPQLYWESRKSIGISFGDPKSTDVAGKRWFVEVILEKSDSTLSLRFIQIGQTKPTADMTRRAKEIGDMICSSCRVLTINSTNPSADEAALAHRLGE